MKNSRIKKILILLSILVFIFVVIVLILNNAYSYNVNVSHVTLNEFLSNIKSSAYSKIEFSGKYADAFLKKSNVIHEVLVPDESWINSCVKCDIPTVVLSSQEVYRHTMTYKIFSFISKLLEPIIFIFLIIWMNKKFVGGLTSNNNEVIVSNVKFDQIAGLKKAKLELMECIDFLKKPEKFSKIQCKAPKGILLSGPPGNGKTMLAKGLAGEAGVKFIAASAANFIEIFVGTGPKKIKELFNEARLNAPCVIFLDEFDSMGSRARGGLDGGNSERQNTINQLLSELDGMKENHGILVLAATNYADNIDPAILRPGRFDREVVVSSPNYEERLLLLKLITENMSLDFSIDISFWAQNTNGFSRASLANFINEAKIFAIRENKLYLSKIHLEKAFDKIVLGLAGEKNTEENKKEELRATAYHEAGHAYLMYHFSEVLGKIYKATIIPHGNAVGLVMPENQDKGIRKKKWIESEISVCFGGRLSEEIFGFDISIGCSQDLRMARQLAEQYVLYGLSDYGLTYISENRLVSNSEKDSLREHIDNLMKKIEVSTRKIMNKHKDQIQLLAEHLLMRDSLTGDEIIALMENKCILPALLNQDKGLDIFHIRN
jgi:cell division protease FtsH